MHKFVETQKNSQIKIVFLWEAVHEIDSKNKRQCTYFDIDVDFKPQSHIKIHLKLHYSYRIL